MSPWIAAAGACVVSLDSMMNIAFPALAAAFAVPPEQVRWVIVCYVLTYAVTAFGGGALGDRVGHARVFQAGAVLTTAGLLLAGLAPSLGWLLAGRVVQGFGSGLIYGTAPGLVTLVRRDGRVLGKVETLFAPDGAPASSRLLVPGTPARLDITFTERTRPATLKPDIWTPPES